MRVFLDTNVLVSAFATRGLCSDLFEVVLLEHELLTGEAVVAEMRRALREKLKLPVRRCDEIVGYVRDAASLVVAKSQSADAEISMDDAAILGEALEAKAEIFVTGDAEVQGLGEIGGMKILSPRQFWTVLHERS